ncbi:MAG TPA: c-type cytochrome [Gammaproteobacteria bacterium]|nr:c-type cytochrome [Gammaproteobacteria bacterium]
MKTMMKFALASTLFLITSMPWVCWAQGNVDAGKVKSVNCVACHGADGNATNPAWPKIAGQHEKYMVSQLMEFKKGESGKRYEPIKYAIVKDLREEDIADLAAYFASQTMTIGEADPALVKLGEKIYRGGNVESGVTACLACHGPAGLGNALANYPRLAGQHPEYVLAQLKKFQTGKRSNDEAGMMQSLAKRMTEQEMQAVASYVFGLQLASPIARDK